MSAPVKTPPDRQPLRPSTSSWSVMKQLWKAARIRHAGRMQRAQQLHENKGSAGCAPAGIIFFLTMGMIAIQLWVGFSVLRQMHTAEVLALERGGKIWLNAADYERLQELSQMPRMLEESELDYLQRKNLALERTTRFIRRDHDPRISNGDLVLRIRRHYDNYGLEGFIKGQSEEQFGKRLHRDSLPVGIWITLGLTFVWWWIMIVTSGDGVEPDITRRRHPMWEWIASHPVRSHVAFIAEMASPFISNPTYWIGGSFWIALFCSFYDILIGVPAGLIVVLAYAVGGSCLNKGFEAIVMIRLAPMSRGAVLGIVSWLGVLVTFLPLLLLNGRFLAKLADKLSIFEPAIPTQLLKSLLFGWSAEPNCWQAMSLHLFIALGMIALSGILVRRATIQGIEGSYDTPQIRRAEETLMEKKGWWSRLGSKQPMIRKELLWLRRDRSALVQAFLIPLSVGIMQSYNLRGIGEIASTSWNLMCGVGIILGTYFLLNLGPRALASEGPGIWMLFTWPRGMEDLLRAKARLCWLVASFIVGLVFVVAMILFPTHWWQILLVYFAWIVFGYSFSEKTVSIVSAPSSSGEMQAPPKTLRWAALLGAFAFGTGVMTQKWQLAIMGIVYSWLSAAAMWQTLRTRLPYLFDQWSEPLPQAPTLLHGMVSSALLAEVMGIGLAFGSMATAHSIIPAIFIYGVFAAVLLIGIKNFLSNRQVTWKNITHWNAAEDHGPTSPTHFSGLARWLIALGGAVMLALLAQGYLWMAERLHWLPNEDNLLATADSKLVGLLLFAICLVAPVTEEYVFRGLLFRSLCREWSPGFACLGSAAFFTIYHPFISWPPVFALGLFTAWLFWRGRRLGPCMLAHAVYNFVVTLATLWKGY